jgi:hypothetical protein
VGNSMRDPRPAWTALGRALAFGAVYDGAFGIAILALTHPAATLLGLVVPADPTYLYLNGVFLAILAGVYAVASRAPERYSAIAPVSAAGRAAGFGLFLWAWSGGRPLTFLFLGCADLAIGAVTFALWRRAVALSD